MLKIRRSQERGYADHGWLKSYHSFSFADYYDPQHMGWGCLRVINEDWVAAGKGFGAHPHQDMEIITYVLEGSLEHQDSLGNRSVIKNSDIQTMHAGTGIIHSEINPEPTLTTHLLQIWIKPEKKGLKPGYQQKNFAKEISSGKPVLVISRTGREGSLAIHQNAEVTILRFTNSLSQNFLIPKGSKTWVQVISGTIKLSHETLEAGDAVASLEEEELVIKGEPGSEIMFFLMRSESF